jgi:hypothetical protein
MNCVFYIFFCNIKLTVGLTGIACGGYVRPGSPGKLVEAGTARLQGLAVGGV